MMTLNGKELNLKFSSMNADDMERYDKAAQYLVERDETFDVAKKNMTKVYESIRFQCHTIFEFFNILFGEGTDRLIFGDETDLGICFTTLAEFCAQVGKGGNKVVSIAAKYLDRQVNPESDE